MTQPRSIMLCFCTLAFRQEPIETVLPRLAEAGYDGAEVFGRQIEGKSDDQLRELRGVADAAGIKLPLIAPYFVLTRGDKERAETIQVAERCVKAAAILGATKIRTFTDVADGIGSDIATPEHWKNAVNGLRTITAMNRSIEFVVETHGKTLADTVEAAERLIHEVAVPNLKINFQPTPVMVAYGLNRAFDRLRAHITHMHLHQFSPTAHGTWLDEPGDVSFPDFISHIRSRGYAGSISVEYCWKDVPWAKVKPACQYMRKLLA